MQDNLNLVIVGHVDHGKSTLIGRLLHDTESLPDGKIEEIEEICKSLGKPFEYGFIMDNLDEERDQGVTIDTAQIFFNTKRRQYTIIDAPGHVAFLKNMITGASQAEAAILIVDAKEGVQEQTRRHAYVLKMLGLKQIAVVINKMDLEKYDKGRFANLSHDIHKLLQTLELQAMYIIPVSAQEGDNIAKQSQNMKWYEGPTTLQALDNFKTKESDSSKPLRFAVQDVYKYDKRIVVGRVESGTLKKGQKVVILPTKEQTVVTSIEEFLTKQATEAEAGRATGLITNDKSFIDRGYIISELENTPVVTNEIKAHIFWMDPTPLKKGERITIKCSTQEAICEVKEFSSIFDSSSLKKKEADQLENRDVADVIIKTSTPLVIEDFNNIPELGRFVLDRKHTCAGGIITEVKR